MITFMQHIEQPQHELGYEYPRLGGMCICEA